MRAGGLALVVALLAACGGGSSSDDGSSGSSGAVPPPGTPPPGTPPGGTPPLPPAPPGVPPGLVPRAVTVAQTTTIPACSVFVDAAGGGGDGSVGKPYPTLAAAVAGAPPGAIVCVAEGTYAESLAPGTKYLTLAGGFQHGAGFKVRDSAKYVTKAQGKGNDTFLDIVDPGPMGGQLTAVDGFEITGYSQAIVRDIYYSQRLDITNDYIHDNVCADASLTGAGFALNNVTGTIAGNVFRKNSCARGAAGSLNDSTNANTVTLAYNLVDANAGTESGASSHGGGFYLFSHQLVIAGNEFDGNTATGWGGGLYVGANTLGGQDTTAKLSWNVYRGNRAGNTGGGFFCDDSASCTSDHEIYDQNCGGNVYFDCGPTGAGPTVAKFDHLTSVRALTVDCSAPGSGVVITKANDAADSYSITNSIFWGNAAGKDFEVACDTSCAKVTATVTYSLVQTTYANGGGVTITFGAGNVAPADPLLVGLDAKDYHLQSTHGHYTPSGYVNDTADSPGLSVGDPAGDVSGNPQRAGTRSELGAFGNSAEASYVR